MNPEKNQINKIMDNTGIKSVQFIERVRKGLKDCGVEFELLRKSGGKIGVGISGGADSVSLFIALCSILENEKIPLVAVTVNHHIRPREETDGDADFVYELVSEYSKKYEVIFECIELKEGEVMMEAENRGGGIEEAARYLRYKAFENASEKYSVSYFALAHNKNDNLETVLMRFLQGNLSLGIALRRDMYIRPLLNISRDEIEAFLNEIGEPWRTDKTNFDDNYLRNNLRLNIIPLLNEKIPSWQTAVLSGMEKSALENNYLQMQAESLPWEKADDSYVCPADRFVAFHDAVLYRSLTFIMNKMGFGQRIPYEYLKDVVCQIRRAYEKKTSFSKEYSGLEAGIQAGKVFVKRWVKKQTDFCFFDIIRKDGIYNFPFGELRVTTCQNCIFIKSEKLSVTLDTGFPFVIRSPRTGEKKTIFVVEI